MIDNYKLTTPLDIYKTREHVERCATDGKVDEQNIIIQSMIDYAKETINQFINYVGEKGDVEDSCRFKEEFFKLLK